MNDLFFKPYSVDDRSLPDLCESWRGPFLLSLTWLTVVIAHVVQCVRVIPPKLRPPSVRPSSHQRITRLSLPPFVAPTTTPSFWKFGDQAQQRGTWKTIALARRSLASSPSSPSSRATTTITVSIDSDKDTTDGSRRAESSPQFGERILGSGVAGFGGDWRIPVETLLSRCLADREACKEACTGGGRGEVKEREKAEAEAGNEGALSRRMDVAEPADIKLFFRELGFEPTGSISTRLA